MFFHNIPQGADRSLKTTNPFLIACKTTDSHQSVIRFVCACVCFLGAGIVHQSSINELHAVVVISPRKTFSFPLMSFKGRICLKSGLSAFPSTNCSSNLLFRSLEEKSHFRCKVRMGLTPYI